MVHTSPLCLSVRLRFSFFLSRLVAPCSFEEMLARVGKFAAGVRQKVIKCTAENTKPPRMTPEEKRLVREMHLDSGMFPVRPRPAQASLSVSALLGSLLSKTQRTLRAHTEHTHSTHTAHT